MFVRYAYVRELFAEAKNKVDGCDEAEACHDVVPANLHVKGDNRECEEHAERDDFLYHLELHDGEWSSVFEKSDSVGGYLQAIFKEGDSP